MMKPLSVTLCCGHGHADQREQYPVGTKVRTIVEIAPDVPASTTGNVTGHCDDGRAWVFFDGYREGHTFHDPALFLTVDSMPEGSN